MEEKKKAANILIDNGGDLVKTQRQVKDIIDFLKII